MYIPVNLPKGSYGISQQEILLQMSIFLLSINLWNDVRRFTLSNVLVTCIFYTRAYIVYQLRQRFRDME